MNKPQVVDIKPLMIYLNDRKSKILESMCLAADSTNIAENSRGALGSALAEVEMTIARAKQLKPAYVQYGTWRRKVPGAHQVFCPRCDGKESCPRPFCPRCGLNMRPPEGVKPDYV